MLVKGIFSYFIFSFLLFACNTAPSEDSAPVIVKEDSTTDIIMTDTLPKKDTVKIVNLPRDWQESFGLIHDPQKDSIWFKPVQYYVTQKECSQLAIDFYYGRLRPADDSLTDELLKLTTTDNKKLRPFYRWCLNKTIQVQDGALAEHTGIPARKYAEKYPKEFFEYMDIDTSEQKIMRWTNAISYSGIYFKEDYKNPDKLKKSMMNVMNRNCTGCPPELTNRIEKFVNSCFNN